MLGFLCLLEVVVPQMNTRIRVGSIVESIGFMVSNKLGCVGGALFLSFRWWGFRVCTYTSLLVAASQHDESPHVLLPDHPPEVVDRPGQRTLSRNKLFLGLVALPITGENTKSQTANEDGGLMNKNTESKTDIGTHRHVVGIDVIITRISMDDRKLDSGGII